MPARRKTLHYLGSTLLSAVAVGLLAYGMSAEWSSTTISCLLPSNGTNGTTVDPGNAVMTLRLFVGTYTLTNCPFSGPPTDFDAIPELMESAATSAALQITVVVLLVLCLLCSAATILISLYNSISNPYETYLGPMGVYTCSSVGAVLSLLALILHACNVFLANPCGELLGKIEPSINQGTSFASLQVGYFMAIPYLVLSLVAIAVVYKYHSATYRHRKQQQRPTEDAPKEIMMY